MSFPSSLEISYTLLHPEDDVRLATISTAMSDLSVNGPVSSPYPTERRFLQRVKRDYYRRIGEKASDFLSGTATTPNKEVANDFISSSESLRGYGRKQFERDGWKCRYCGLDCTTFELFLFLTLDHIIPKAQRDEVRNDLDDPRNYATACRMCNSFANRMRFVIPQNVTFEEQIESVFSQKKKAIQQRRDAFREYWVKNIKPKIKGEPDAIGH